MSKTINRVEIQGNVGRDAEQKSSKAPVKFSVATGNDNKPDGSGKYPLVWHNVTVWNNPDALKIKKGDYVHVAGRLNYTSWIGNDGAKRSGVEIVAYEIKTPAAEAQTKQKPLTPDTSDIAI